MAEDCIRVTDPAALTKPARPEPRARRGRWLCKNEVAFKIDRPFVIAGRSYGDLIDPWRAGS